MQVQLTHIREAALLPRRTSSFKVQQPQEDKKRHGNWHKTPRFSAYDPAKVSAWLTHNLVLDQTATIPKIKLFTAYTEWCSSLGLRVMSSNIFGKFLFKLFPSVKSCRPGQAGRQITHYRGIAWSQPSGTTTSPDVSPVPSPRSSNPSSPSAGFFDDIGCQGDSSSPSSPFSSLTASPVDVDFLPSYSPSPLSPQPYVFSPFCCKPTPRSPEEFKGYNETSQATNTRKMTQTPPASVPPVLPPLDTLPPFKPTSLPHHQPAATPVRLPPVSSLFSASFNPTTVAPPLTPLRLSQEQYFKPILHTTEHMPSLIDVDESYRQTPSPVTAPSRSYSPSTIRMALREKAGEEWEFGALEDLLRDCHGLLSVRFKDATPIQYENLPHFLNRVPKTTLLSSLWLYGEALKHGNAQDAQYQYLVCLNSLLQENATWEILCASYVLEETCDLWFAPDCTKIIKDHLLLVAQGANPSKMLFELKALKQCTEFYLSCTGAQA